MLDRIDMDVIDMAHEIILIANGMFPIAPLPDTAFDLLANLLNAGLTSRRGSHDTKFVAKTLFAAAVLA
jgi:hypothetical protein